MKIAVIGAKIIGGTLARKWARAGHQVMFGVRSVNNPETAGAGLHLHGEMGDAEAVLLDAGQSEW